MRQQALLSLSIIIVAVLMSVQVRAEACDDALRMYAVNVVKTPPFAKQFTGYGIYLGQGRVITAAHVVGHWPLFTHPRVLIAGQDLPAKVIKKGSFEEIDVALLSIDEAALPVSLRLRRNPLCKQPPRIGMEVVNVVPERTSRARILSSHVIVPEFRSKYDSVIDTVEPSGSGLFDAERKCLLGIISGKLSLVKSRR